MSENTELYPMKFCSIRDNYKWGYEEFELADLGYRDTLAKEGYLGSNSLSEIMETYMDRIVGDNVYMQYGRQFPVQVKRINCSTKMPLRVHPDDVCAEYRYDALGKEKLWYILKADKNAQLIIGFNQDINASQILDEQSLESYLNFITVKPGQAYRIAPGIVHGAIGQVEILEISQSSALDFCVYTWGEEIDAEEFDSSLNLIDALDFIDYKATIIQAITGKPISSKNTELSSKTEQNEDQVSELLNIKQFIVNKIDLTEAIKISSEKSDSYAVYYCLYGSAQIKTNSQSYKMASGSLLLVPAELNEIIIEPLEKGSALIEVLGQN